LTKNVSFASGMTSPLTVTLNAYDELPAAITWPVRDCGT
jgi:hypothetical protein